MANEYEKKAAFRRMEFCVPSRRPSVGLEGYSLDSVYTRCSDKKRRAWFYCKRLCNALDGTGLAVSSHNIHFFTARFYFLHPEDGREMVAVITPKHNWCWYVD